MTIGLTQIGASPRSPAPAAVLGVRPPAAAEPRLQVPAARPVPPVVNAAEAREQIRHQVMAERGVDMLGLYRLSAQDRLREEAAILIETARRAAETLRPSGNFLNLRV